LLARCGWLALPLTAAEASLGFAMAGGEAWTLEKSIELIAEASACDAIAVASARLPAEIGDGRRRLCAAGRAAKPLARGNN